MAVKTADYLKPYRQAASQHGDRFGSLLWASPRTQAARFDAICRLADMAGKRVLDAGCGRADLMDFLAQRGIEPADYMGIEAVDELVAAAMKKKLAGARIVHGDFVREPLLLNVNADVIVFSGSLNTVEKEQFYLSLKQGFEAAGKVMVFNFLAAKHIANAEWLTWHHAKDVFAFARSLSHQVRMLEDYLDGDCTIAVLKSGEIAGRAD
jgi:2-polyprenyl-3-methyl-5-hydroxy-6-metoxy-1,4-benzoquinol methylase